MQREADPLLETHPGAAGLLRWASHNFCTCSLQGSPDSNSTFVLEVELPLSFLKSTAGIITLPFLFLFFFLVSFLVIFRTLS